MDLHAHDRAHRLDKMMKYRNAALFSYWMGQPMPVCPPFLKSNNRELFHFPGMYPVDSLIKCHKFDDRHFSFTQSLLYMKRGMPRASEAELQQDAIETLQSLTSRRRPANLTEKLAGQLWREDVKRRLRDVVKVVFDRYRGFNWFDPTNNPAMNKVPSRNSHFGRGRKSFGALGSLSRSYNRPLTSKDFIGHELHRVIFDEEAIQSDDPIYLDFSTRQIRYQDQQHSKVLGYKQIPFAELHPLAEPCKIRTISKGQDHLYNSLSPFQSLMFSALSHFPQFLCWRPVDSCILVRVLGRKGPGEVYVSGDYKAATNNLHPELSEFCIREIASVVNLPDSLLEMALNAATRHEVCFDAADRFVDESNLAFKSRTYWDFCLQMFPYQQALKEYAKGRKERFRNFSPSPQDRMQELPAFLSLPQKWGQLMGSPVSFPVLCLINFAAISCSLHEQTYLFGEKVQRFPPVESEKIIVNGDDCVFSANPRQIERWKDCTKYCGLELSVGKTYFASDWLIINSTLFRDRDRPHPCVSSITKDHICRFSEVGFLNLSLMYGLPRSGSGEYDPSDVLTDPLRDGTMGSRLRKLISRLPTDVADFAYSAFMNDHKKRLPPCLPKHLPAHLLGMDLPERGESKSTDDEILVSWFLIENPQFSSVRPIFNRIDPFSSPFSRMKTWLQRENIRFRDRTSSDDPTVFDQFFFSHSYMVGVDEWFFQTEHTNLEQQSMRLELYDSLIDEACRLWQDNFNEYLEVAREVYAGVPIDYLRHWVNHSSPCQQVPCLTYCML